MPMETRSQKARSTAESTAREASESNLERERREQNERRAKEQRAAHIQRVGAYQWMQRGVLKAKKERFNECLESRLWVVFLGRDNKYDRSFEQREREKEIEWALEYDEGYLSESTGQRAIPSNGTGAIAIDESR